MTATRSEPAAPARVGSIVPDPRRPASVRVVVRGQPLLTIPREVAEAEGLAAGVLLEPGLLERLSRAADEEAAFRTALRALERRPFAARDLTRRLVLKGHPPAAAAEAVARAERHGLVDDGRFALHYAETRAARGRGPARLRRDLAALGVARDVIDHALASAFGPEGNEAPQAEGLARQRLTRLAGLPRPVRRRRLLAFLARRGFTGAGVRKLVEGMT